jgi:prophage tail gpP-like protein
MPNPQEVAELVVGSLVFQDWESVWVQHRWQQGWPTFRFASTEGSVPLDYRKLQFKPGDPCEILLGGQLAVTGIITNRQVAYSSTEKGIQLSGVGRQWAAVTSSVPMEGDKPNFDKMTVEQAFSKAAIQVRGKPFIIGKPDATPLERFQAQPGEKTWDLMDRMARMREASIGSDHLGNILLIGEHTSPVTAQLVEGENILKMQCVFSNEQMYSEYALNGQFSVTDEKTMRQAAQVRYKAQGTMQEVFRLLEIPTENQDTNLQRRATYEALQADGTQVVANVTVQGWLRDGVNLWRTGDLVVINSPMCPLNLGMKIQTATFAQDSRAGTTTLLECVLPWKLGDKQYAQGNPSKDTPKAPEPAKDDTVPKPQTPSAPAPPVQGLE